MDKARNAAREEILYGDDEARLELAEQGRLYAPYLDYRPLGEAESAAADILVRPGMRLDHPRTGGGGAVSVNYRLGELWAWGKRPA